MSNGLEVQHSSRRVQIRVRLRQNRTSGGSRSVRSVGKHKAPSIGVWSHCWYDDSFQVHWPRILNSKLIFLFYGRRQTGLEIGKKD